MDLTNNPFIDTANLIGKLIELSVEFTKSILNPYLVLIFLFMITAFLIVFFKKVKGVGDI